MKLIEREEFLAVLQEKFKAIKSGEGHCILISGESGIGKTTLTNFFCKDLKNDINIYRGTCDALFTPRPLAPLYDVLLQMHSGLPEASSDVKDRTVFFSMIFQAIQSKTGPTILIFEDIHWADEATLDFIKFLARRIAQLPCLFLITYRDNEIHTNHPLRNVLGQLNPGSYTRMQLPPLSKQAVEKLAAERNYKGEEVYKITGGNPYYVSELLSSYSLGLPENIKDSILSAYNRCDEKTKQVWDLLSVIPSAFEIKYLLKLEPSYALSLDNCMRLQILIVESEYISFKHELFRRAIESSLSPLKRILLNKRILELLKESFEQNGEIERIVHHAKNANDYELVVQYAPQAARQAASVGAHTEASKLYLTAIEYYQGNDKDTLIGFYQAYAYECYLTNQLKEGIIYIGKAIDILALNNDVVKRSSCMRLLSWLWWFDGNGPKAEAYARKIIELLKEETVSGAVAMAFAHLGRLKMLSDEKDECLLWSEKAMRMAEDLADVEIISYTLNTVGSMLAKNISTREKGLTLLQQSMDIARKINNEEYIGHAYANLIANAVRMKDYPVAKKILPAAVQFLEERDMDLGLKYLLGYEARVALETGNWDQANVIVQDFITNDVLPPNGKIGAQLVAATLKMRRGESGAFSLLQDAGERALNTAEPQRIVPALTAMLEYEWITGEHIIQPDILTDVIKMAEHKGNVYENSEFAFWLKKVRGVELTLKEMFEGYNISTLAKAEKAAGIWRKTGCPYNEALVLFAGTDDDKRKAITIVQSLGANAVYEKMKFEMRSMGVKKIPRGRRKATQSNPAQLTDREMDILQLMHKGLQNKEIASRLFISSKTVDHHITSILYKLEVNSRVKAVQEAIKLEIIK